MSGIRFKVQRDLFEHVQSFHDNILKQKRLEMGDKIRTFSMAN